MFQKLWLLIIYYFINLIPIKIMVLAVKPSEWEIQGSIFNLCQLSLLPVRAMQLCMATRSDSELSKVLHYTLKGSPTMQTELSLELQPYWFRRSELTVECGWMLWGVKAVVPRKLQQRVLMEIQQSHQGIVQMKSLARSYVWWPRLDAKSEELVKSCQ